MPSKKPRTKKIITEEIQEIESEAPTEETPYDPGSDIQDDIYAEHGAHGPDVRLKLSRIRTDKELEYLVTYPNDRESDLRKIDEAFIKQVHGGGRFDLRYYRGHDLFLHKTLNIAGPPKLEEEAKPNGTATDPVLAMLMQQNQFLQQQLLQNKNTPVGELAGAVKEVMQIAGPREPTGFEKLFDVFIKGLEMGKDSGGGGNEFNWKRELADFAKPMLPAVMGFLQQRNAPSAPPAGNGAPALPAGPAVIPGLPPELQAMLAQGVQYLKGKARAGKNPDVFVEMVMENREEEINGTIIDVVCNLEFSQVVALDPEVSREPYQSFFRALYDGIRQAVAEEIEANQSENIDNPPDTVLNLGEQGKANGSESTKPATPTKPAIDNPGGAGRNAGNPPGDGRTKPRGG